MRKITGLENKRFGMLRCLHRDASGWLCECDCGKITTKAAPDLISGKVKSCGCQQGRRSHGLSRKNGKKTPLYGVWAAMKQRCLNPKAQNYDNYGGRGISVCEEWFKYEAFHQWAVLKGYRKGLTIERIDNDGNYCPKNCTWVSMGDQSYNKRTSKLLKFNGKTRTYGEWQNIYGINRKTLQGRIKRGWPTKLALTLPPGKGGFRG